MQKKTINKLKIIHFYYKVKTNIAEQGKIARVVICKKSYMYILLHIFGSKIIMFASDYADTGFQ